MNLTNYCTIPIIAFTCGCSATQNTGSAGASVGEFRTKEVPKIRIERRLPAPISGSSNVTIDGAWRKNSFSIFVNQRRVLQLRYSFGLIQDAYPWTNHVARVFWGTKEELFSDGGASQVGSDPGNLFSMYHGRKMAIALYRGEGIAIFPNGLIYKVSEIE